MPPSLAEIVENKKREIESMHRAETGVSGNEIARASGSFLKALSFDRLNLICEIKPRSPSLGHLKEVTDLGGAVSLYSKYADCLSILTDEKFFGGSLSLLRQIDGQVSLPLLCKDFILDRLQCVNARLSGADAVLLIVKILSDDNLRLLHETILDLGMTPVVEIQNQAELERALAIDPQVILINNRDLSTFVIDFATTERLAPLIPDQIVKISASGISKRSHIDRLLPFASNFLIGSALMQSDNLEQLLQELRGDGKAGLAGLKQGAVGDG